MRPKFAAFCVVLIMSLSACGGDDRSKIQTIKPFHLQYPVTANETPR